MSAKYMRQVRAAVLEELNKDYVMGASARGIRPGVILWKSVLKSSMLTIITLMALSIGSLLGGTAIIESIFMWDGVGKLAVDSITMRDYPMIQAYVVWMAVIYVLVNLISDLLYHALDPRNSSGGEGRMNHVTVRIQKKYRDNVRMRLIVFGTLAGILVIASAFSRYLTPYDPYLQDLSNVKAAPSALPSLGTDRYGRDMLSRVIAGSRASVFSTLLLVSVITVVGTAVGILCGWRGDFTDTFFHEDLRCFSCLSWPGVRAGGGRQLWRRTA